MEEGREGDGSDSRAMELLVSGRVQGVGFRHFVASSARESGVHGYVRNRRDGRVEIHAEGGSGDLDRLYEAVRKGPVGSRVMAVERSDAAATGSFLGFEIRF